MKRRQFLSTLSLAPFAAPAQTSKTNIVLILADDLGYECLNCYGGTSYKTPNLDRMAAQGVRFTHAYAQPLCTPTRVQLMTGLYNNRNWKAFGIMDPKEHTFGHRFQKLGYKTAMAGKWQFWSYNPPDFEPEWRGKGMLAEQAGFDEYCVWHALHTEDKGSRYGDPTYMVNGKLVKEEKDKFGDDVFSSFLMNFMEKHRNEPFFVYYPMALTHGPFNPTPRSANWTTARLKNDRKNFADMVAYMDEVVGRVWKKVEDLGIAERTLILFFSDNGTDKTITSKMGDKVVQGGKGLTTDAGTRVPCIGYWKGRTPVGKVCDDLVDSSDFYPTILDAVGAKPDRKMDGRSFLPQLLGKRGNPREWTYCWFDPRPGHGKEAYTKLVQYARTQRYKLYDDGRFYDVPNDVLEQRPLPASAGGEAGEARKKLQAVLQAMR
ncbi:MAG: sulfatase-like hydrolase/transferase [Acidobacteria bacterium]|nr:sulfatase-like hydrolase/transferase [Acidobacteriota bacterium]